MPKKRPGNRQGVVEESELVLLRVVMDVLGDLKVPVWLDQGSLLGVVREGGFLPVEKDEDVDLGVWRKDFKRVFPEFARRLRAAGARVDFPPTSGAMMIRPSGELTGRPVNIGVYRVRGGEAVKKAALVRKALLPPGGPLKRVGRRMFPPLVWRGRRLIDQGLRSNGQGPGGDISYRLGSLLVQLGLLIRFRSHRQVTFSTPARYFGSFKTMEVYGMRFLVPEDTEGYLEHKYGGDWRVPRSDWVFWEQDGAIARRDPEASEG